MAKTDDPTAITKSATPPAAVDNPFTTAAPSNGSPALDPRSTQLAIPYSADDVRHWFKVLFYSPYGYGKTSLIASAAKHPLIGPMLILNFEGGLLSIKGVPNVTIIDVRNVDQVEDIFWKLIQKVKTPADPARGIPEVDYGRFQSVAIDSGTELQVSNLENLARNAFAAKRKNRESVDDIFQEDYGKDTARLRRVFRWFRDMPLHFFVTALSKSVFKRDKKDKDAEPELISVQPAFTNKLGESVAGYCDHVWYVYKDGDGKRWMLPQEKGVFRAKTRGHKFAAAMGDKVLLELSEKDHHDLASLYDLLIKTENIHIPSVLPTKTLAK